MKGAELGLANTPSCSLPRAPCPAPSSGQPGCWRCVHLTMCGSAPGPHPHGLCVHVLGSVDFGSVKPEGRSPCSWASRVTVEGRSSQEILTGPQGRAFAGASPAPAGVSYSRPPPAGTPSYDL